MISRKDAPETPSWACKFSFSICHHVASVAPHTEIFWGSFGQGNNWSSLSHPSLVLYPAAPLCTQQFGTDLYREVSLPGSALHPVLGSLHFSFTCSILNMLPSLSCIFWHSPSFSIYSTFPWLPFTLGKHDLHFYCTCCILAWLGKKPDWQVLIPVNLKLKCCWFMEFSPFKN